MSEHWMVNRNAQSFLIVTHPHSGPIAAKTHTDHSTRERVYKHKCDTHCVIVAVLNIGCSNNLIIRSCGGDAQLFRTSKNLRIGAIAANLQRFPCDGMDLQDLKVTTNPLPHLFHNRELLTIGAILMYGINWKSIVLIDSLPPRPRRILFSVSTFLNSWDQTHINYNTGEIGHEVSIGKSN